MAVKLTTPGWYRAALYVLLAIGLTLGLSAGLRAIYEIGRAHV